jgi:hypothetical protein
MIPMLKKPNYEIVSDEKHNRVYVEINIDNQNQMIIALEDNKVGPCFEFYNSDRPDPNYVRCKDLLDVIQLAIARLEN